MKTFEFTISTLPQTWNDCSLELLDEGHDLEISARVADFPLPFDAVLVVDGSDVVLQGGADVGGFGSVLVRLPRHKADTYLELTVTTRSDDQDAVISILRRHDVRATVRGEA